MGTDKPRVLRRGGGGPDEEVLREVAEQREVQTSVIVLGFFETVVSVCCLCLKYFLKYRFLSATFGTLCFFPPNVNLQTSAKSKFSCEFFVLVYWRRDLNFTECSHTEPESKLPDPSS